MAELTTVLMGVLVIAAFNAELHFTNAGTVPELSVKLLCELLCEHCNGVSNMESGHCVCEVPETHFKDNAACLERVQISAAEMNLKLTHTALKNTRRKRSFNESFKRMTYLLGGPKSITSHRDNNSEHPSKPSLPELENMDRYENKSPVHLTMTFDPGNPIKPSELMRKDDKDNEYQEDNVIEMLTSVTKNSNPKHKHVDKNFEYKSPKQKLFQKLSVNNAPILSLDTWYSKKAMDAIPSPTIISDSESRSSKKLSGLHARREKRSTTKESEIATNDDKAMSRREIYGTRDNGDVDFHFDADISIPIFPFGRVDQNDPPNPIIDDKINSQSPNKITNEEVEEPKAFVLNKFRNSIEEGTPGNTNVSNASVLKDMLIRKDSTLLPETKTGLLNPTMLKESTLQSQAILNGNTLFPRNKLNDLRLKLPPLLSRDKSTSPLQSLLPTNKLIKEPKPLLHITESTPLTKLELFSPLSSPSLPLAMSQNNLLSDLITNGNRNRLMIAQPEGMTLLERIKNYQSKLKQRLSERKSAVNLKALPRSNCLLKYTEPGLTSKLNPLVPKGLRTKNHQNVFDCDDSNTNVNPSPIDFTDKSRLKVGKLDIPDYSPTSTPLPNDSTDRNFQNKINQVNGNEETARFSQSTETTLKSDNDSIISSPQHDLSANSNSIYKTPIPTVKNNNQPSDDDNSEKFPQHPLETTSKRLDLALSESTMNPVLESAHTVQTVDQSPTSKDAIQTFSDHPHFLNHHDDRLFTNSPNHFPSLLDQPTLANIIGLRLSPEDRYRAMFDPTSFQNYLQQINYPALLARNDLYDAMGNSVLNRPMAFAPNYVVPFDHPSHLMTTFNEAPDTPTHIPFNEPRGMIMNALVPENHQSVPYPNDQAVLPPSSIFILKPLPIQGSNIPYPDLLNHLRTGNAVIEVHPIDITER